MIDDHARARGQMAGAALEVDPGRSNIILAVGTKGSGKSEAMRQILNAWPHDRVVIDITGDAAPTDPATITMTAPFPRHMPEPDRRAGQRRVTVWARVDPRRAEIEQDQQDALAMGLHPKGRQALVMVDEYGMMATAARIPGDLKLALMSSRHYHLTLLLCCPRPKFIPVLTVAQADKIFVFDTPNEDDRAVLAKNMGYPLGKFEAAYEETMRRGPHSFLLYDKRQKVLIGCPPLPLDRTHGPRA